MPAGGAGVAVAIPADVQELFDRLVKGADPVYGRYVDNTDVFKVMNAEMGTGDLETPAAAGTTPSAATQPEPVLSR